MTYQKQLTTHLADYKKNVLKAQKPGYFRGQLYPHILAYEDKWLNVFEGIQEEIEGHVAQKGISLHRYFHHLNSSQAFAFNLFYPYFFDTKGNPETLLKALGQTGPIKNPEFEKIEFHKEGTNIDVYWESLDGSKTYCEVKLSEAEFGKAKNDDEHRNKLKMTYLPKLAGKVDAKLLDPKEFFKYYQLMRYMWLIAQDDKARLILLLPQANKKLWKTLDEVRPQLSTLWDRVSIVATEDVIANLCKSKQLTGYAEKLKSKYVP
ncbi:hypothetical protein OR1_02157 [Geobacter sp. OR-1]|uniref:PGN_0703 family putative restriction endonuclease n=1 Tax=Geobacter sp. OR-1 TaxID=1266765 RepID=UPI00054291BE|nr:hypothetical protein [Geobacter sp. OR-1]GAM09875.1 hypothetical protein OR1_02157 [Geobacter sp. OR-1]